MLRYLRYGQEKLPEMVELIRELVECESSSDSADQVNRLVDLLIEKTSDIAQATTFAGGEYGRHLLLRFDMGSGAGKPILGLGHSDTVWPLGTLGRIPFRQQDGRLWGPGVLDMKAGLVIFIYAVRALRELNVAVERPISLLVVSDEEVGSANSRRITEEEARRSSCVLVLEPGTGLDGKLKTARKGIARYEVLIAGVASHAGVNFESGASAVVEAARQIECVAGLTDLERGITVNPGVVRGGTRSNVIAADASIEVDVRGVRQQDLEWVDERLKSLAPVDPRCRIMVSGGLNRPPMERTPAIAGLFERAKSVGREMGLELEESSTGGGSDGNFTAALGIPTLDGLGAVGEGAHAMNESILVDRIAGRVALLAGLLEKG